MTTVPAWVNNARATAARSGFGYSCDDRVGRLLAVLAASVPADGRILELGTGAGVGTGWLVHGLGDRFDVEVLTVEIDPGIAAHAQAQPWPAWVRFVVGDAIEVMPSAGKFDLVFADAQGGKWERIDLTVGVLRPGALLVVDDMTPENSWTADQASKQAEVRRALLDHPSLTCAELGWATGVILCARRA